MRPISRKSLLMISRCNKCTVVPDSNQVPTVKEIYGMFYAYGRPAIKPICTDFTSSLEGIMHSNLLYKQKLIFIENLINNQASCHNQTFDS